MKVVPVVAINFADVVVINDIISNDNVPNAFELNCVNTEPTNINNSVIINNGHNEIIVQLEDNFCIKFLAICITFVALMLVLVLIISGLH